MKDAKPQITHLENTCTRKWNSCFHSCCQRTEHTTLLAGYTSSKSGFINTIFNAENTTSWKILFSI